MKARERRKLAVFSYGPGCRNNREVVGNKYEIFPHADREAEGVGGHEQSGSWKDFSVVLDFVLVLLCHLRMHHKNRECLAHLGVWKNRETNKVGMYGLS